MRLTRWAFTLCALSAAAPAAAYGDEYHYKNILVGERAFGLGGAYSAISDDPSGIYYNPAGLAFSMENYISGSANAFSSTQQQYKNVVAGQDYSLTSQGIVPVFFGVSQSLGRQKVGFAVIVPNSDLFDQDDLISNISSTDGLPNNLRRRFFRQDITYLFGPAISKEIFENFAVGLSLMGFARLDKRIDNQFVFFNPVPNGEYYFQAVYLNQMALGLTPKLGIQYMPVPKWSIGFAVSRPFNIWGKGDQKVISTLLDSNGTPKEKTGATDNDISFSQASNVYHDVPEPLSFTIGNAVFFSKRFLVSADLDYHLADGRFKDYPHASTFNWSLGAEYYLFDSFPVRLSSFSNNANTPAISASGTDQPPHVNMIGGAFGVSWLQPGSSFTLGVSYAYGSGQAQIVAETPAVQELIQNSLGLYLTGSYQL